MLIGGEYMTRAQINRIKKIISDHMEVLMQIVIGEGKPSQELLRKLKLPKEITDMIKTSYQYGRLGVIQGKSLTAMSEKDVEQLLRKLKVTKAQQRSVDYSKMRAQQAIDTLTQKITATTVTLALQSDQKMWEVVKEVIPDALENNTPRHRVIQQLRDNTQDLNRDWHRVAHTEMWNAKLQGEAEAIINNESPLSKQGGDTLVYKKPAHNACKKCKQLLLEPDGVTPKVFKMSELIANGDNYGLKQADWKPVVGTIHPNCMCPLNVMPPGTKFDSQGNLVPDK